jgi:hypothetical protein
LRKGFVGVGLSSLFHLLFEVHYLGLEVCAMQGEDAGGLLVLFGGGAASFEFVVEFGELDLRDVEAKWFGGIAFELGGMHVNQLLNLE